MSDFVITADDLRGCQCLQCKHYKGELQCEGFVFWIPPEILEGRFDHTKPHRGDNGARFEQGVRNAIPE